MKKCKIFVKFSTIIILFSHDLYAQKQNYYPGTPSSSYNIDYSNSIQLNEIKENKESLKDQLKTTVSKEKVIVKGNVRLDTEVIIRDSKINDFTIKNSKAINLAVKNLFATGYFKDVKIFKPKSSRKESKENYIICKNLK